VKGLKKTQDYATDNVDRSPVGSFAIFHHQSLLTQSMSWRRTGDEWTIPLQTIQQYSGTQRPSSSLDPCTNSLLGRY